MIILYQEALKIKDELIKFYRKKKTKIQPVGALIRKEHRIEYLEFITSKNIGQLCYQSSILSNNVEIKYYIWYVPKRFLELTFLIKSYPDKYMEEIRKKLQEKGYTLTEKEVINNSTLKSEKIKDFKEIVKLAGVQYYDLSHFYEIQ
jgi:hypothetical protein